MPVASDFLPSTGVLFLGGHPNTVKKLRQYYPKWEYASPEKCNRKRKFHQSIIFYWTNHSSHKLMQYVYARLDDTSQIHFVTATNTQLLVKEMEHAFSLAS